MDTSIIGTLREMNPKYLNSRSSEMVWAIKKKITFFSLNQNLPTKTKMTTNDIISSDEKLKNIKIINLNRLFSKSKTWTSEKICSYHDDIQRMILELPESKRMEYQVLLNQLSDSKIDFRTQPSEKASVMITSKSNQGNLSEKKFNNYNNGMSSNITIDDEKNKENELKEGYISESSDELLELSSSLKQHAKVISDALIEDKYSFLFIYLLLLIN